MRRPLLAGISLAAVLVFAACSTDEPSQVPLAPTKPLLAAGDQCAGSQASLIAKEQKALFSGAALNDLQAQFAVIKSLCPNASAQLMTYLESVIGYSGAPTNAARAQGLVNHFGSVTLYVTSTALVRPAVVFQNTGGAAVLSPGESMTTWDALARLAIDGGTTPAGPHLFTFEPRPTSECDGATSLRLTGGCYQVHDYPDETATYTPPATLTLCMRHNAGPTGIAHQKGVFGTEVLPEVSLVYACANTHAAIDSWLGREAGPLGRAVARAYDYLAPRPLFADDAGESGSIGSFSLVGGILNVVFEDDFTEIASPPDVGDSWLVQATHPGYIQVQNGLGDMTGSVVVLSQGQGACTNCPVFQLLGTRVNSSQTETVGTYEVSWRSVQDKPSVKEAPFVVLNNAGAEIARLSYVTESSNNILRFTAGGVSTDVGNWVRDVSQSFKITVNLTTLNPATSNRVSLEINGSPVATNPNAIANATTLKQIGYVLTGIDAGIIGADDFRVIRLPDIPPP